MEITDLHLAKRAPCMPRTTCCQVTRCTARLAGHMRPPVIYPLCCHDLKQMESLPDAGMALLDQLPHKSV